MAVCAPFGAAANMENGMQSLHIGIVGAGLGGLCLAQGLTKAGHRVDVFERDATLDARGQGYRLRIDPDGQRALATCLSSGAYDLFRHSCAARNSMSRFVDPQFGLLEERRPLHWKATSEAGDDSQMGDLSAHRQTLRDILRHGLEERIHLGQPVLDVVPAEGGVDAILASGGRRRFDLLVAADGVSSGLRDRLLADAAPDDTGTITIYGKLPLAPSDGVLPDAKWLEGVTVVFGDGVSLVVEPMRFRAPLPELARAYLPGCELGVVEDYLYWAFVGRAEQLGGPLERGIAAADLAERALDAARDWHTAARRMVALSDTASLSARPVRMARDVPVWPTGRVTLLGDAIHAMSPAGGLGANTALADAASLASLLARADGPDTLIDAVGRYEGAMRERARRALHATREAAERLLSGSAANNA